MNGKPGSQLFPLKINEDQLPSGKLGNKSLNWDFIGKPSNVRHLRVSKYNDQIPSTYQKEKLASHSPMYKISACLLCLFREGNGTPLQYSCLENSMDGGAW